jgi:hypothetical protein
MSVNNKNHDLTDFDTTLFPLIRLGGLAALVTVVISITEIAITFLPGGNISSITVKDWLALFENNPFMGLRNLGLLNLLFTCFGLPMFLALFQIHKRNTPTLAFLALIASLIGASVFLATNRAFPMLELSNQYQLATAANQKMVLEAAGQSLLAVGESHTPGTFIGFALSEIAGILISAAMIRRSYFSKITSLLGLVGFSSLLVFEVCVTFFPNLGSNVMVIAMVGGIANLSWSALTGLQIIKISKKA